MFNHKKTWALLSSVKGNMIYGVWLMFAFCELQFELVTGAPVSLSERKHE